MTPPECPRCKSAYTLILPQGRVCQQCGNTFGIDDPTIGEVLGDDVEYLEFFRRAILAGYAANTARADELALVARATLHGEYGDRFNYYLARLLCDIFGAENGGNPETAQQVLDWCERGYPIGHMFIGSLKFLDRDIIRHLRGT
jgi:hypothetical protein